MAPFFEELKVWMLDQTISQLQSCAVTSPEPFQSKITARSRTSFLALHRYGATAHLPDPSFYRMDGQKVVPALSKLRAAIGDRLVSVSSLVKDCVLSLALCGTNSRKSFCGGKLAR